MASTQVFKTNKDSLTDKDHDEIRASNNVHRIIKLFIPLLRVD